MRIMKDTMMMMKDTTMMTKATTMMMKDTRTMKMTRIIATMVGTVMMRITTFGDEDILFFLAGDHMSQMKAGLALWSWMTLWALSHMDSSILVKYFYYLH